MLDQAGDENLRQHGRNNNNQGSSFAGSGSATPTPRQVAEARFTATHNLNVILNGEGIGSAAERAAGYIAANPGTRSYLTTANFSADVVQRVAAVLDLPAGQAGAPQSVAAKNTVTNVKIEEMSDNALLLKEAQDFLRINSAAIRQGLIAHMDPQEVDRGIAYVQQNPEVLVQGNPEAFAPIRVASSGSPAEFIAMAERSNAVKKSVVLQLIASGATNLPGPGHVLNIVGTNDGIHARALAPASLYNQMMKVMQDTVLRQLQDSAKRAQLIANPATGPLMKFRLSLENLASGTVVIGIQGSDVFSNLMDMVADSAGGDLARNQKLLMDPSTPFISKPFIAVNALGNASTIVVSQVMKVAVPGNFLTLALYAISIPRASLNLVATDIAGLQNLIRGKIAQTLETNPTNARVLVNGVERYMNRLINVQETTRLDLLMPGGKSIGVPGSRSKIRIEQGGAQAAQDLFNKLIVGGEKVIDPTYEGIAYKFADGSRIGLRLSSTSGPPAIDVGGLSEVSYKTIHFLP